MKQQPQRRRRRAPKREEVSTTHVRKGIFFLMILLGVVSFCAVAGMLVKLMLVDHDYYEAKAIRNQTRSTSVTASRGTIYDRNGNVLAASSSVENVFLDPLELSQNKVDVPALAKKLAAVLDLDAGWIEEQAADTSLRYKVIKRRQAQEVCDKVREIIAEDKVIGVHLEPDSQRTVRVLPDFDEVLPLDKLADAAAACDILVCCIALTPETRGIMSEEIFGRLHDGAIFVNVARGALADEAALTKWLQSGGRAVLDVFEEEPLPESSPLWDMENVLLTPHNSFVGEGNRARLWETIKENLG